MTGYQKLAFYGGPLAAASLGTTLYAQGLELRACWTAAITTLCAVWWVFEPIPLPATALIPFTAFPLVGVLAHGEVARSYGHSLVLLMLAGSIMSTAMEKSGAHKRLALAMVRVVGETQPARLVLGFLLASAVLSMWISNSATVVVLLPVALAVLDHHRDQTTALSVPLLLAVAYGAAIGGTATPIGTPPNLILISHYQLTTGREIGFAEWMRLALPVVLVMLPLVWLWLVRRMPDSVAAELPALGPWRPDERRVLVVFLIAALAWITRSAPYGGWAALIQASATAGDSTVALAAVVVMFILPSGRPSNGRLLDWSTAVRIPWGVFIMIGGGMAIGQAFEASGLGEALGDALAPLTRLPLASRTGLVTLSATILTEVTSNTAMANVMMPILAATGRASAIDPWLLMVPATLGLNWSFMLPVATAANAIVYGTGRISIATMAREGFCLNLVGTVVITGMCLWLLQ